MRPAAPSRPEVAGGRPLQWRMEGTAALRRLANTQPSDSRGEPPPARRRVRRSRVRDAASEGRPFLYPLLLSGEAFLSRHRFRSPGTDFPARSRVFARHTDL